MKKFLLFCRNSVLALGIVFVMAALPIMVPQIAGAQANEKALCEGSGGTWSGSTCSTSGSNRTVTGTLQQVVNIIIFVVGAVSVLMIAIGGLRYAISGGDQSSVTAAKNTIIYAIIGLVVAFAAYAIVNFVLTNLA